MPQKVGIDLGSSYVRIWTDRDGVVLRAPCVVAVERRSRELVAVGGDAKRMLGKTPANILAYSPVTDGTVTDYDATVRMLSEYFSRLGLVGLFSRPKVIVSLQANASEVAQMAIENAVLEAGARSVAAVESPLVAAIGSGLRTQDPRGCMVVDLGGGSSENAVISSGGIVTCNVCKMSGNRIDQSILHYLKTHRKITVGETTAEQIKLGLGVALPDIDRGSVLISGLNSVTGRATTTTISSGEVFEATKGFYNSLARYIIAMVEDTPPEIATDINDFGIMLTGGCSQIPGIDGFLRRATGLRVTVAKSPLDSTILGIGRLFMNPGMIKDDLLEFRSR